MTLKFYYDLMSQPCRALYIFLKHAKIPFEPCVVALRKGEHLGPEFKKINPLRRVPVIHHDGFGLAESVAIFQYLTREFDVPEHWYPKDSKHRAKVDEYMSWQQWNTRYNAAMIFRTKVIEPIITGKPADEKRIQYFLNELQKSLHYIESVYLKDQKFLCGNDITFADLLGACELEQPQAIGYDILANKPTLQQWMDRVKERTQPYYDEAHQVLHKVGSQAKLQASL